VHSDIAAPIEARHTRLNSGVVCTFWGWAVRLALGLFVGLSLLSAALSATAETRVALIIGNNDYASAHLKLANPSNDAVAMQRALRDAGFETIVKLGPTCSTAGLNLSRSNLAVRPSTSNQVHAAMR
jgi:hypothetical protein